MNIIFEHWQAILIILAALALLAVLLGRRGTDMAKAVVFYLVTVAERDFGAGTGSLKKSAVIKQIYEVLPGFVKIFVSEAQISAIVETGLEEAKKSWQQNEKLQNFIAGMCDAAVESFGELMEAAGIGQPFDGVELPEKINSKSTLAELKAYALAHEIDIGGAVTRAQIRKVIEAAEKQHSVAENAKVQTIEAEVTEANEHGKNEEC